MSMKKRVLIVVGAIFALAVIGNNLGDKKDNTASASSKVATVLGPWYTVDGTAAVLADQSARNPSLLTVEVVTLRGHTGGIVKLITRSNYPTCTVQRGETMDIMVDGIVVTGHRACVENDTDVFNMLVFSGNTGATIISAFEKSTTGYVTIQGEKFSTKNHRQALQKVLK